MMPLTPTERSALLGCILIQDYMGTREDTTSQRRKELESRCTSEELSAIAQEAAQINNQRPAPAFKEVV